VNDTTVIRGGVGLFWGPTRVGSFGQEGYSASNSMIDSLDGGLTPYSQGTIGGVPQPGSLSDPFPGAAVGFQDWNTPVGNANGRRQRVGEGISMNHIDFQSPYVYQYSAEFQKELPGNMALAIGYLGSRTERIRIGGTGSGLYVNQLDPSFLTLGSDLDEYVDNPFYGDPAYGNLSLSEQLVRRQLLRPYPHFSGVTLYSTMRGYSRYNSLRVQFRKRFRGMWGARVNYTYARMYDNLWQGHYMMQDEPGTPINTYDLDAY
jgi:hypothetical protein